MGDKKPRRARGDGSVFYRADRKKWVAVLEVPSAGSRKRRTTYAATKREALLALHDMQRDAAAHQDLLRHATVAQWMQQWLDDIASERVRPSTLADYRSKNRLYITPHIGKKALADLRPADIRSMHRKLRDEGLSPATLRKTHAILHRALTVAEREGYLRVNPATLMDGPTVPRERKPLALSILDAQTLVRHVRGTDHELRLWCALIGMRQGEALGLPWDAVTLDGDEPRLVIRQALQRVKGQGLVIVRPKSATSYRSLSLWPELAEAFRAHRRRRDERAAQWPDRWANPDGLVFTDAWGGRLDPAKDYRWWRDLLKAAGVPHARLHDARHTAAYLLLGLGVPMASVKAWLGHSSVDLTVSTYGHVGEDGMPEVAAALGQALGSGTPSAAALRSHTASA